MKFFRYLYLPIFLSLIQCCLHAGVDQTVYADAKNNLNSFLTNSKVAIEPKINGVEFGFFVRSVADVESSFNALVAWYEAESLPANSPLRRSFGRFCSQLAALAKKTDAAQSLRPWHGRFFYQSVEKLQYALETIVEREGGLLSNQLTILPLIKGLSHYVQEFDSYFSQYIGTPGQRYADILFHRPSEWFSRNWWWAVPTAVALTAGGIYLYKKWRSPDGGPGGEGDPSFNYSVEVVKDDGVEGRYTKLFIAAGIAAPVFAAFFGANGCTMKAPVMREVVCNSAKASSVDVGEQPKKCQCSFKIVQLPALKQNPNDCGFHMLYNAKCLHVDFYQELLWEDFCRNFIEECRKTYHRIDPEYRPGQFTETRHLISVMKAKSEIFEDMINERRNRHDWDLHVLPDMMCYDFRNDRDFSLSNDERLFEKVIAFRKDPAKNPFTLFMHVDGNHYIAGKFMCTKNDPNEKEFVLLVVDSLYGQSRVDDAKSLGIFNKIYRLFVTAEIPPCKPVMGGPDIVVPPPLFA